ncbi:MAG TPA: phosphoribosyltransferase family protein [Chloroflexia bacterium]|nr:phosphoribosyltransferase family protein [Chloroflexia bacterium]
MVGKLLHQLPHDYDNILVITRGGMVPACLISEKTHIRNILCAAVMFYNGEERALPEPIFLQFPEDSQIYGRRILVVDDVWDTGSTVVAVRDRLRRAGGKVDVCVLNYKPRNSKFPNDKPDYFAEETDAWIVYPWDPERELP